MRRRVERAAGRRWLAAFADRFLLRVFVEPIADAQLETLLESGWNAQREPLPGRPALAEMDALAAAASALDLGGVRPLIADCVRRLRGAGIALSDRRVVKLQQLVAAATVLDGRTAPSAADLWPVIYALPTAEAQALGRDVLREYLGASNSQALAAAAESASHSPALRAQRLQGEIARLLSVPSAEREPNGYGLRLEALLREVDASFAPGDIPGELVRLRTEAATAIAASVAGRGAGMPIDA